MLTDRDPPHYLKALKTTSVPRRLLWLNCDSRMVKRNNSLVQEWRCGALGTTHFTSRRRERKDTMTAYDDPQQLWATVDDYCVGNRRVVLWAYDLALQLRISKGLVHLPLMGWSLKRIVLERTSAWASFQCDDRSLLMCDIKSWCPVEFDKLVAATGHDKPVEREFTAGPEFRQRVMIWQAGVIRDATMEILNWIESNDLGQFRPTGSGQSYAAFRRKHLTHRLLVHDDERRLAAERAAMWTGRCEAWRHGRLAGGPFVEYDMHAAYATIARDCDVPAIARRHHDKPSPGRLEALLADRRVLARVTATTRVPCLPARVGERTAWPTGTFTSWLWDPEIQLALTHCDSVKVHECYTYEKAPALSQFAGSVLDGMADDSGNTHPVVQRVMKHWSRCLVGRLGLRYRAWEPFATSDDHDLRLVTYVDSDDGTMTDMLIAGKEWLILTEMREALESLPQVPSWVMSECRRRLWDAMSWIGLSNVVYLDTDSLIIDAADTDTSAAMAEYALDHGWFDKGTYQNMTIHGPRNYETTLSRKVAGLPLSARQVAPLEFTGEVMRSIKESMRAGQLDCVASLPRTFKLNAVDMRRQHLAGNMTTPFHVQPHTTPEDYA